MNVSNTGNGEAPTASIAIVNTDETPMHIPEESLVINASIKPFINILWAGTAILVIGFFISIYRRRKDL